MLTPPEDYNEVKRLTEALVKVLNAQDFDYTTAAGKEFVSHVAPDFEARFDTQSHSINFEQQTKIWRKNAQDYPALHFSVLDMTVKLQRRSQTASVFLRLAVTGMHDVQYQGSCELKWRYDDGLWILYWHQTMRGPLFDGFVA